MKPATPFEKILIANRGEIALRIQRAARALGYRTVAVYSRADAAARHVFEADEAVLIGEAPPADSYLNVAALLAAARATGADAVHPGYGFLAENAAFASACRDAGLVFIGPSPEAIAAMGDKARAKALMRAAGVPCVPGYDGEDQSEARLETEAAGIGFPVMIKATAGGGGRGMRQVEVAAAFPEALAAARSEALNAFGDPRVLIERAVPRPRHVEIQVFGDRHGGAVHLGERDCSVQRRHQKLIEEAPSPAVSPELRARMGAVAVAAVKAIGYEGAGTLEFLLGADEAFYFMEMNTRLQVEHPVTEAVTGLDLVEWQLRIAAGEPLPLTQDDVRLKGHSIEARLCAEDAEQGFLPQSGRLALWRAPEGVRVEHALRDGAEIPAFYDSMIAKVVAHGASREEARRKLRRALEETVALGVPTNQTFLIRCLDDPLFAAGETTTAFIAEAGDRLAQRDDTRDAKAAALAASLLIETSGEGATRDALRPRMSLPLTLRFELDGIVRLCAVRDLGGRRRHVTAGQGGHDIEIVETAAPHVRFACDGVMESAAYIRDGARLWIRYRGQAYEVLDLARAPAARPGAGAGGGRLKASLTGRVVAVHAELGQRVEAGQPLITLEAMKMEHVHLAPLAGVLKALHVKVGDQTSAGRALAEIEG